MELKEDPQLNKPASRFFTSKLKCDFSRVGFTFSAGELDVLAYDRRNKCFHVCEGKRSANIASVGHAIGQLVAYISMIQENGYDFLNRVSKEEHLELTDFSSFLEKKAIKVCFYIVLPLEKKQRLLAPAQLMLNNMGDFGSRIGIFFATKQYCELAIEAQPLEIKIRRIYTREAFIEEIADRFLDSIESKGLTRNPHSGEKYIQFKEKDGNPFLHYEVWLKQCRKSDTFQSIEVAFHLEFAKSHLVDPTMRSRKRIIQKLMSKSCLVLTKKGFDFQYRPNWGKQWSSLYIIHKTSQRELTEEDMIEILRFLKELIHVTKPLFDAHNWGRKQAIKN